MGRELKEIDLNLSSFNEIFLSVVNDYFNHKSSISSYAHGRCMFYAFVVGKIFNGKVKSYVCYRKESGHSFVKIGNRFYDSENPQGVLNWRLLQKYLKNVSNLHEHRGVGSVLKHWGYFDKHDEWVYLCKKIENKAKDLKITTDNLYTKEIS